MYRNLHRHSQRPASTMKLRSQPGIVIHKLLPKLSLLSHHRSTRGAKTMILMRHHCSTLGAKTTSTILMRHHCSLFNTRCRNCSLAESPFSTTMGQRLRRHHVSVVNDFADKRFSRISSRKRKISQNRFSPFT